VRLLPRRGPKREPLIRPEDILLSKRITWRTDDPFTIFECRDFLPPHVYHALAGSFPTRLLEERLHSDKGRQARLTSNDPAFADFLEWHPIWGDLHAAMMSQAFIRDVFQTMGSAMRAAFRRRPGSTLLSPVHSFLLGSKRLHRLTFELNFSISGYRLSPHIDKASKLLAMMLYFPESTSHEGAQGGTGFWRQRSDRAWDPSSLQKAGQLPRLVDAVDRENLVDSSMESFSESFERFHVADYRSNSMSGFVKTQNSWHDVDLRGFVAEAKRRVLLYNIHV
jgi:hypothetical protein